MTLAPNFNWQAIEPDYTPEYVASLRRLTGAQKLATADLLYRTALARKVCRIEAAAPLLG